MSGRAIQSEIAAALAEASADVGDGAIVASLHQPAETSTPWEQSGNGTTVTLNAVVDEFDRRLIDGEQIRMTDKRILLEAGKAIPRTIDTLEVSGVTYTILSVKHLSPGGLDLMYEIHGRA